MLKKILEIIKYTKFHFLLKKEKTKYDNLPIISGKAPIIENLGTFIINGTIKFRCKRLPIFLTVQKKGLLIIDNGSFFNDGVNLCARQKIHIGTDCKIGDNVYIYDTDFHQTSPEKDVTTSPIIIGKNVWIGANSMILAGTTIGDHSVIAAGSIVRGNIPERCIAAGSPARIVKYFSADENWIRN